MVDLGEGDGGVGEDPLYLGSVGERRLRVGVEGLDQRADGCCDQVRPRDERLRVSHRE